MLSVKEKLLRLLPHFLLRWFKQKKIIKSLPTFLLKDAIQDLALKKLNAVSIMAGTGESYSLNIEDLKSVIPTLKGRKLEEVVLSVYKFGDKEFKIRALGALYDLPQRSIDELLLLSPQNLHIALILIEKDLSKEKELFKKISPQLYRQILPLLSEEKIFKVLKEIDLENIHLCAPYCSDEVINSIFEKKLEDERLKKIIPRLSRKSAKECLKVIRFDEESSEKERIALLHKILSFMTSHQIATVVEKLAPVERKNLLAEYADRPIGLSTRIANKRIALYQLASATLFPKLCYTILKSAKWMDKRQLRVIRDMLKILSQSLREIAWEKQISEEQRELTNEEENALACAKKLEKLTKKKKHPLHKELIMLSDSLALLYPLKLKN